MEFTAKQIAELIHGSIEGDENAKINTFAKIEEGKKGAISFLSNPKYTHYIYETESSVVLINNDVVLEKPTNATLIRVENAYECVAQLLQIYESMKPKKSGIDSLAFVSPSAKIGEDCYIGAFAYVGDNAEIGDGCQIYPHAVIYDNVKIGNNTTLYPNVSIYHDCKIGNNVVIHSGTVIGADGFGFAPNADGYDKIPQIGIVTKYMRGPLYHGQYIYKKRCETRQPYSDCPQRRGRREHRDGCTGGCGRFHQGGKMVYVRRSGGNGRTHFHC